VFRTRPVELREELEAVREVVRADGVALLLRDEVPVQERLLPLLWPHDFFDDEREEDRPSMLDPAIRDEPDRRSGLSDDSPDRLPRT